MLKTEKSIYESTKRPRIGDVIIQIDYNLFTDITLFKHYYKKRVAIAFGGGSLAVATLSIINFVSKNDDDDE
ncbi:MAG: hypothetical protein GY754_21530 [bacterium]|nr:hypothetical protein [bacterium]